MRAPPVAARTQRSDAGGEKDGIFPAGVGDLPSCPRTVRYREVAALLSDVPANYHPEGSGVRGMRRDMRAHAKILNHIIASRSILPFRFGVVFPSQQFLASHVLKPQYQWFMRSLDELGDTVELTLRATYVEPRALEEVVAANPRLAAHAQRPSRSYQAKLELGRRVSAALQVMRQHDAERLLQALRPLVRDVRLSQTTADLMVLKASLLVERNTLARFDRALARIHEHNGDRLRLECLGPLPPYSFIDMTL